MDPALAARLCLSSWIPGLIVMLSYGDLRWSFCWSDAILVLMKLQVSYKFHACRWHYCQGGLGMALRRSENMRSILSGVDGGLMGKLLFFPN